MKNQVSKEVIIFLIVLLFAYTAADKLIEHKKFVFQLSLAPMPYIKLLSPYLSWLVPLTEIFIVITLLMERTRLAGLYTSIVLLTFFEIYVIYMLTSGLDLPCACGGVISLMTWKQHIPFNAFFIAINFIAIKLHNKERSSTVSFEPLDSKDLSRT
jgi:putative oxidoreductase